MSKIKFNAIESHHGTVQFDIVAMVSSAGGLAAVRHVLEHLPAAFPAAIVLVQHLDPRHRSLMAGILSHHTQLAVKEAEEGDRLSPGHVFLAPPNRHLLVNPDRSLSLSQSELVHFLRPSGDLLFESVAASHKDRAIAVVLTGTGSDGAMGLRAIKKMGGTVVVQNPEDAEFDGMPQAAIATQVVDFILSLDDIADALVLLVGNTQTHEGPAKDIAGQS
ncbi:MAG TPA: chemotaxis protein CheB [Nitrospiraceae bacterium]|nr:chemotaxis protein CheB [Nitrospiraceae bacterium]